MRPTFDITGLRSGRLVAIRRVENYKNHAMWLVRCDCGNELAVSCSKLRAQHTRSCGCFKMDGLIERRRTHGQSKGNRLYSIWGKMRGRCTNPNIPMYYRYGGRGITICDEWGKFTPFRDWALANGYTPDLTIDRINNDGNYEPSNCRWVGAWEQSINKSNNRVVTYRGVTAPLIVHVQRYGFNYDRVLGRLRAGWDVVDAFERPARRWPSQIEETEERKQLDAISAYKLLAKRSFEVALEGGMPCQSFQP